MSDEPGMKHVNSFDSLLAEHSRLLEDLSRVERQPRSTALIAPDLVPQEVPGLLDRVCRYIETLSEAGEEIVWVLERNQLLANLRFWADYVERETGSYPTTTLRPANWHAIERDKIRPLKVSLQERNDLPALEQSIKEAKRLQALGWLTDPDMRDTFQAAQAFVEEKRQRDSELLVALRSDALVMVREGIEQLPEHADQVVFDPKISNWLSVAEIRRDAEDHYQRLSADAVRQEIVMAKSFLPAHPEQAVEQLNAALNLPISEKHKREIISMRRSIEEKVALKNDAKGLIKEAESMLSPLDRLATLRQAESIFPHLDGLSADIHRARREVLDGLIEPLTQYFRKAEEYLQDKQYQQAIRETSEAQALVDQWPEPEPPESLSRLRKRITALRGTAEERRAAREEFRDYVKAYEEAERAENEETKADLLQKMRDNRRLAGLTELDTFLAEKDPRPMRSSTRLEQAKLAREQGDWLRVLEITDRLLETLDDLEPSLRQDVLGFHEEARQKLDNTDMQNLYKRAVSLAQRPEIENWLAAWRTFRYVGGDRVVQREEDWPEYHISFRTAEAQQKAPKLAEALHEEFVAPILRAWDFYRDRPIEAENLVTLAKRARSLREAGFLPTDHVRQAVEWAEVSFGQSQARDFQARQNWDGALRVWESLSAVYPASLKVQDGLNRARAEQILARVESSLRMGEVRQARETLYGQSAQGETLAGQPWQVYLAWAKMHAEAGDYERAASALSSAERAFVLSSEGHDAKTASRLEQERLVLQALTRAERYYREGQARQALATLQRALGHPNVEDRYRLERLRDRLFAEREGNLLHRIGYAQRSRTDEAVIDACMALVELVELEDVISQPRDIRRSTSEIEALRSVLMPIAHRRAREAQELNVSYMKLREAVKKAEKLKRDLEPFARFDMFFQGRDQELKQALDRGVSKADEILARFEYLKELLNQAEASWKSSFHEGSFRSPHKMLEEMTRLKLAEVSEVRRFGQELAEWEEIYEFLSKEISKIREDFDAENFREVVDTVGRVSQCPARSPGTPYQYIEQSYNEILRIMDEKVRVFDKYRALLYGIQGWESVADIARARWQELEKWEQWHNESQRRIDTLKDTVDRAEKASGVQSDTPFDEHLQNGMEVEGNASGVESVATFRVQLQNWKEVEDKVQDTLGVLSGRQTLSVHSDKAQRCRQQGDLWQTEVERIMEEAGRRMADIGPQIVEVDIEKLRTAADAGRWEELKSLTELYRRIGVAPDQEDTVTYFEELWKNPPPPLQRSAAVKARLEFIIEAIRQLWVSLRRFVLRGQGGSTQPTPDSEEGESVGILDNGWNDPDYEFGAATVVVDATDDEWDDLDYGFGAADDDGIDATDDEWEDLDYG